MKTVKILIVDDEQRSRRLLELIIISEGFKPLVAANAEQALMLAHKESPAAILLDLMMPGTDGLELIRRLRKSPQLHSLPVIAISGVTDQILLQRLHSSGVDDVLTKPVQRIELAVRLRRLLSDDVPPRPIIPEAVRAAVDAQQEQRSSSMYMLLSRVNRVIVRASSPDELFARVCELAVESGLFDAAWIGLLQPQGGLSAVGNAGFAGHQLSACMAAPGSSNIAARVINDGGYIIYESLVSVQGNSAAQILGAAGLSTLACFALHEARAVAGVLVLGSLQPIAFEPTLLRVVAELVDDISYSLTHFHQEQQWLAAESRLHYLTHYNAQTGLPSRVLLERHIDDVCHADSGLMQLSLFDIRLHRQEPLRRIVGQATVDAMMRQVAARLDEFRQSAGGDFVAQLSPDEFVYLRCHRKDATDLISFSQELHRGLSAAYSIDGREFFLKVLIGFACFPEDELQASSLLARARVAAEHAQRDNDICRYHPDMDKDSAAALKVESELHRALERGEFQLHYQPQLSIKSGTVVGVEALLRWQHPERGWVAPNQFIPLLEASGLMIEVGRWVMFEACRQAREWQQQGLPPLRIAVNLSSQQFYSQGLLDTVQSALQASSLDAEWLELELTESLILESAEQVIAMMHALKALGVSLSLDDFGTGYSSLSYLRRFPIDRLKVDRSFVRDIVWESESAVLTRTIIAMAKNLGLSTIAEGVEDEAQLAHLHRLGCDEMQGFLFSRALAPADLAECLRQQRKLPTVIGQNIAESTLLVVDNEAEVCAALKRLLHRDGLTVLSAESAESALQLLAQYEVGLVLCDQRMPGMSGTEFLNRVRQIYPETLRMLLTGYTDLSSMIAAINRGALYKVLTKPWQDDELRDNIREALHQYSIKRQNKVLLQQLAEQAEKKQAG